MTGQKQNAPLVFNIQKFSIHDGPGIRTTIFFKGCPLSCPWCHNPESQQFQQEHIIQKDDRCEIVGKMYSVEELVKKAEQDIIFYDRSHGGVTLSGGEALAQDMEYMTALAKRLQEKGITVGVDTCGYVPYNCMEQILPYTDFFLYDIKIFDREKHKQYIGVDNTLILNNLRRLNQAGAVLYLRLIMVDGINMDDEADINPMLAWLQKEKIAVRKIHLLPYHTLGKDKYTGLGRTATLFTVPSTEQLDHVRQICANSGYTVVIGG